MPHITRDSLMSLEQYHVARPAYRTQVIEHKKQRTLHLGHNMTLLFEDEMTIRYQIQEMLRIEKVFEEEGIQDELGAYNPLIPDGRNWKATMLIEYTDVAERQKMLAKLHGVEKKVFVQVEGHDPVHPFADEDLDRESDEKTSAVHFLRFELTDEMVAALKSGAALSAGVNHPEYQALVAPLPNDMRLSLIADLA
jgi:Protein of unknown function (DUF3501)